MEICDLHCHSVFSDGTCTPAQIIDLAVEAGLSAVALCDHNTVDGLPRLLAAAEGRPVEAVAGAEFSVDYGETELHLLGLYIPQAAFGQLARLMEEVARRKEQSNVELVERLARAGYPLDYDAIRASTPNGRVNRPHIAQALIASGHAENVKQAFRDFLSSEAGYYVPHRRITVWEMLEVLTELGAVPVLAHPFLNLNEQQLTRFLPEAKAHGLVGMECRYTHFDRDTTRKALAMAQGYGLRPSGGSDFHGANSPGVHLGTGLGDLVVPYGWAQSLRTRAGARS